MQKLKNIVLKIVPVVVLCLSMTITGCGSTSGASDASGTSAASAESSVSSSVSASASKETEQESAASEASAETESSEQSTNSESSSSVSESSEKASDLDADAPKIDGLTFDNTTELEYAECFKIYNYEGGYALIDIIDNARYLVVPDGMDVPEDLDEDIIVLQQPLDRIYLAATSAMSLFDAVGSVDNILFSGTNASGWYIDSAVEALNSGKMIYAGKYSEPDYETMVDGECDLAIESTMIYHTPKVKEMIEDLGIPVLVDRSSYESHPLGRTEWIKLYAVLTDKEDEAESFFEDQTKVIEELKDFQNTGKTVAYFYVNTDGTVVIRSPQDYIPKMIEIGGGVYLFNDIETNETGTAFSISMEEFYTKALDADYLIYNGSIDNPISTIDELIAKNQIFADLKAVKEGNVWTSGKNFYQRTDIVGQMIKDINLMLTDGDESEMTFLSKVK